MGTSKILIDGVGIDLTDDTVAANKMLSGTKAHDANGDVVTGSIPSKAAATYTPGTSAQTIGAGQYLSGAQTIQGDADLMAGNIKSGVDIFGVTGTLQPAKTEQSKTLTLGAAAPATVTPDSGKALSSVPVTLDTSVIKAENIAKDAVMLGITGTHEGGIKLASIAVTTPPTKTAYKVGETFSTTGMVVTATYSNGATVIATGYNFEPSVPLTIADTSVTIRYSEGGVTKTATQAISVTKTALTVPTQLGSLTYNGGSQSPTWSNYDSGKMTLGGATSGTNAGSYNATFTLKDTSLYEWVGGTTAAKTVAWSIGKAAGSSSISKSSIDLGPSKLSDTITVTRSGTGAITAQSSDTSVATVSVSGNVVTVSSVNGKSGSATITVKVAADTNYTAPSDKTASVTASFISIYGVSWAGTSATTLTRTDDAAGFADPVPALNNGSGSSPFDNCMPWSGMVKEERTGGTMVKIPKFWYKLTQNGNGVNIQIADGAVEGFSVSPAHMNRGDGKGERDYVYIGRYHCHTSSWKSQTGGKPKASITRSSARSSIHNLGTNIWQCDFAMRFTIWLLYIVEFANWNSQTKIGYGCGNNSSAENMGYTDSMQYHTGTKLSSRTSYGLGTQYRWIEGLWDNVYDWCDGCYYNSNGLNIILKPSSFSDSSGGTLAGSLTNGYPSALSVKSVNGIFPVFMPSAASGSNTTYVPDYWSFLASGPCLYVGGYYNQNLGRGMFYVNYSSTSLSYASIGCRLQELP